MKFNRRSFFSVLPFLGMACKTEAEKPALSFEEELRKLIFESPHLCHYVAGECPKCGVWMDNRQLRYVTEFYGDPHPDKAVRGAAKMIISFDPLIKEWKIGTVTWRSIRKR